MKFITLSVIMIGIVLIFNLGGITTPSVGFANTFFSDVDSDTSKLSDLKSSNIWVAVIGFVAILAGGAIASLFGRAPPESYIIANLVITILGGLILTDFLTVFGFLWSLGDGWIRGVATLVFIPSSVVYILSLISYWRGSDG